MAGHLQNAKLLKFVPKVTHFFVKLHRYQVLYNVDIKGVSKLIITKKKIFFFDEISKNVKWVDFVRLYTLHLVLTFRALDIGRTI